MPIPAAQTYNFTVQATDSSGNFGQQPFSLVVFELQVTNAGTTLNPGDCASISATPSMPVLAAVLNSNPPLSGTVTWSLSVQYTGPDSPPAMFGPYTFTPTAGIPATQPWNISFGTQLVGGTATLTYTYMGTMNNAYPFSLCINGTNPNQSTVLGYLGTNPWFLPKIASVESGFQQFCLMPSGCLNGASSGQPFWTQEPSNPQPSHDFGLMQINRIQYPQLFSVLDLFSWQRNTNDGIRILNGKPKSGATASWNNSVSLYQQYATMHGGNPPPTGQRCVSVLYLQL